MSNQSKITFTAPFPFCDECKYAKIERNAFYATGNKEIYQTNRCSREPICSNAVARYKELIEERANRPYDAMGDDQGRGGTSLADEWYRQEFVGINQTNQEQATGRIPESERHKHPWTR